MLSRTLENLVFLPIGIARSKNRSTWRSIFLATSAVLGCASVPVMSTKARAQTAVPAGMPPVAAAIDDNNVDVVGRTFEMSFDDISIGPNGPGGLKFDLGFWFGDHSDQSDIYGNLTINGAKYYVAVGDRTETFTLQGQLSSGTFIQDQGTISTLTYDSVSDQLIYKRVDGSIATFGKTASSSQFYLYKKLAYPAGEIL